MKEVDGEEVMAAVVHVKDNDASKIPESVTMMLPNGKPHKVPVKIITDVGDLQLHHNLTPGAGIGNEENGERGTFGCVLFDKFKNENYMLTCYHVLNTQHNWEVFQPIEGDNQKVVDRDNRNKLVGNLIYGRRDEHLDIALAKPLDKVTLNKKIKVLGKVNGARKVSNFDVRQKTKVTFKGSNSLVPKDGFIVNIEHTLSDMPYPDQPWELSDLIVLSSEANDDGQAISQPGDSGALVVDEEDHRALGIIVAGNKKFSYVSFWIVCFALQVLDLK